MFAGIHKIIEGILGLIGHWGIRAMAPLFLPQGKKEIAVETIRTILVFGTVGIGNMVLFTPFIRALRDRFPGARISLVLFADKAGAEQVLLKSGLVDEIHAWIVRELSAAPLFKVLPEIFRNRRKWKADLVISRYNTRFVTYNLITLLSRAPYRIGHVYNDRWNGHSDYLYNYPVVINEDEPEERMYLRLGKDIGFNDENEKLVFYTDSDDERRAGEFLAANGIGENRRFLTVQTGTSPFQQWKNWGRDKWTRLIQALREEGIPVVLVGIAREWEDIRDGFPDAPTRPVVAAGALTLQQSAAVVKRSRLLVSSDSCMAHIAAAMDVPAVTIFGPTNHRITAPTGDEHIVIRKDLPCSPCYFLRSQVKPERCPRRACLESIKVEEVLDIVRRKWHASL